jgi:hypothetical protein
VGAGPGSTKRAGKLLQLSVVTAERNWAGLAVPGLKIEMIGS